MNVIRATIAVLAAAALSSAATATPPLPIEPTALPPAVEQGVDMVYIDPEIAGNIRWRKTKLDDVTFARYAGAPLDLIQAINPLYADLRRGLVAYQRTWGVLPQFTIPAGPPLTIGSEGKRVTLLRERLGLPVGSRFDEPLSKRIAVYQKVHGLKIDGIAGDGVIASLNLGAEHYEHVVMINMERARRLPAPGELTEARGIGREVDAVRVPGVLVRGGEDVLEGPPAAGDLPVGRLVVGDQRVDLVQEPCDLLAPRRLGGRVCVEVGGDVHRSGTLRREAARKKRWRIRRLRGDPPPALLRSASRRRRRRRC